MAKEGRARGPERSQRVHEFVNSFLDQEGMRMLRRLSWKLDHQIISELIAKLYFSYLELKEELVRAQRGDAFVNTEIQQEIVEFPLLFGVLPYHRSNSVSE